jgi:hypothetical protein
VFAVRAASISVALGLWLRPIVEHQWTRAAAIGWIAVLASVALLACFALDRGMPRLDPPAAWSAIACSFGGTALSLALSGSLALGLLAGSAAAAALGVATVLLVRPGRLDSGSVALVLVTISAGLLLCGTFYSALPPSSALLLLAAPLAPSVLPVRARPWSAVRAALVCALIVALVAALAAGIAYLSLPPFDPGY